jgi:hypothetical protein
VPNSEKGDFIRDLLSARRAIANGVVDKTSKTRAKYWRHWCQYAEMCGVNPFIHKDDMSQLEREIILCSYSARVRSGAFGRGAQIKVQAVTDALAAVSKTIQLAGEQSPIYEAKDVYKENIGRMVEGYRRDDPPAVPQLAVPITVPNFCYKSTQNSKHQKLKTAGELVMMAFYYLLRVGEYTKPKFVHRNGHKVRATRTKQFSVGDVGFFKDNKILPRDSPLDILLTADSCTLKITNKKMEKWEIPYINGPSICQLALLKQ